VSEWQPGLIIKAHTEGSEHSSDARIAPIFMRKVRVRPYECSALILEKRRDCGYAGDDESTRFYTVHPDDLDALGVKIFGTAVFCEHEVISD
jgi:hypothetical protein